MSISAQTKLSSDKGQISKLFMSSKDTLDPLSLSFNNGTPVPTRFFDYDIVLNIHKLVRKRSIGH